MSDFLWPHGLHSPWNSPGQDTEMGSLSLLQGIFPTQGSNPGLPYCRRFLYQLNHKGSPRILEWVAHPFSGGSSWPRNWTRIFCIADGFFTNRAMREALYFTRYSLIRMLLMFHHLNKWYYKFLDDTHIRLSWLLLLLKYLEKLVWY